MLLVGLWLTRWWLDPRRAPVPVLVKRFGVGLLILSLLHATARPAQAAPPYAGHWNTTLYYHADYKGSETFIAGQTAGENVQKIDYWPYGAVRSNTVNPSYNVDVRHKFTGQELDSNLGLYYYGGRWYDAETGRFISPDPYVQDPLRPQNLNRYSYVVNNPTNLTDPSGYFFGLDLLSIFEQFLSIKGGIEAKRNGGSFLRGYNNAYLKIKIIEVAVVVGVVAGYLIGGPVGGYFGGVIGGEMGALAGASWGAAIGAALGGTAAGTGAAFGLSLQAGAGLPAIPKDLLRGLSYFANVEAIDIYATGFANTIGKVWRFYRDMQALWSGIEKGDPLKIAKALIMTPVHAAFPYYGYYGGLGYGKDTWGGEVGIPEPLNKGDYNHAEHDRRPRHRDWARGALPWNRSAPGTDTGLIGQAYNLIGIPFFYLGGFFQ